jgi:hypothetical protein
MVIAKQRNPQTAPRNDAVNGTDLVEGADPTKRPICRSSTTDLVVGLSGHPDGVERKGTAFMATARARGRLGQMDFSVRSANGSPPFAAETMKSGSPKSSAKGAAKSRPKRIPLAI